jgi:hypothetical protein
MTNEYTIEDLLGMIPEELENALLPMSAEEFSKLIFDMTPKEMEEQPMEEQPEGPTPEQIEKVASAFLPFTVDQLYIILGKCVAAKLPGFENDKS